ncbi:PAS domain-containing sensor histidine kinase [Clostridium lundense]|uniref:PAS domain-containing sensor histidine kinase n=1 Tax=Clostridium lundense TaxID=319475 RepID=UPI000684F0B8|nr:PAS domain-containing sensor histidine kinase [Clostridium lundense]
MGDKRDLCKKIFTLIILLLGIFFYNDICFSADEEKRQVLLIGSYSSINEAKKENFQEIKSQIEKNHNCYLVTEYLDSNKINDNKYAEQVIEDYKKKYNEDNLYLIVAHDSNSFNFINKYGLEFLGKAPLILSNGANNQAICKMLKNTYRKERNLFLIPKKHILNLAIFVVSMLIIIILMLLNNIEKRKTTEKLLRENEDQIKNIINATPDIICFKDKNGKYIKANEAHRKFLNLENVDYIGKSDEELLKIKSNFKEDIYRFIETDKKAWGKKGVWRGEEKFIDRDGICKVFDVIKVPIYNEDGSRKAMGVIGRDITERKINEELKKEADENVRLLEKAKESDKLKTEFFANVSHELRTPLNIMLSSFQLIELYIDNGSIVDNGVDLKTRIKVLKKNSLRLLKLINNIIDITKIDSGFYEAYLKNCNIVNLVEETTLSVAEYMESNGIDLVFDTDVEERVIACDPEKMERIMLNLLSNATKFTPSGGRVDVNLLDKKNSIIISVKDTGIGIPKDKQQIIFERFGQASKDTNANYEGSGIGLSLVKSLIEMQHGTIKVKSECGSGSEFIIELPCRIINEQGNIENIDEVDKEMIGVEFSDLLTT